MLFNTFRFRLGIVPENGTTFMQMLQQTVMTDILRDICTEIYMDLTAVAVEIITMPVNNIS